jgi:hypothetical protein
MAVAPTPRAMRSQTHLSCVLGIVACVTACSGGPTSSTGETGEAIVNGTLDRTHSAVVSILIVDTSAPNQGFNECSGSIVQVASGVGTVLTAAHCCGGDSSAPNLVPSIVVIDSDYGPYENEIGNANPSPPAYPVVTGSVQWDQQYNGNDHDFCMLQFSGAPPSTPTLALPTSSDDGLSVGVKVEYVGFGATSGSANDSNSRRFHATAKVDQGVSPLVIQYSQGRGIGGPCEGDSGGPALMPAGAPQSQQVVVATTSYGDQTCSSYGVSSRVSSEVGPGGFITQYLGGGGNGGGSGGGGGTNAGTSCFVPSLGQSGQCMTTSDCAALSGYVSSPGHCPGPADVQCCTGPGQ